MASCFLVLGLVGPIGSVHYNLIELEEHYDGESKKNNQQHGPAYL